MLCKTTRPYGSKSRVLQCAYRALVRLPNCLGAREACLHQLINQSGVDDTVFVRCQAEASLLYSTPPLLPCGVLRKQQ